jgi:hypothetical protein
VELTLDFGHVKDMGIWTGEVVMKPSELLQRDALDISSPFDGDPLKEALQTMVMRVSNKFRAIKPC